MDLLLLSGNSVHNRDYIYVMRDVFAPLFDECYVQEYAHWDNGEPLIDIDYELQELQTKYEDQTKPYVIFAKSIGSVLSIKAIAKGILNPERCIFVGFPVRSLIDDGQEYAEWLSHITVPLLFLQNKYDPYGSYEEVKAFLDSVETKQPIGLVALEDDTHDYDQTEILFTAMASFATN